MFKTGSFSNSMDIETWLDEKSIINVLLSAGRIQLVSQKVDSDNGKVYLIIYVPAALTEVEQTGLEGDGPWVYVPEASKASSTPTKASDSSPTSSKTWIWVVACIALGTAACVKFGKK